MGGSSTPKAASKPGSSKPKASSKPGSSESKAGSKSAPSKSKASASRIRMWYQNARKRASVKITPGVFAKKRKMEKTMIVRTPNKSDFANDKRVFEAAGCHKGPENMKPFLEAVARLATPTPKVTPRTRFKGRTAKPRAGK